MSIQNKSLFLSNLSKYMVKLNYSQNSKMEFDSYADAYSEAAMFLFNEKFKKDGNLDIDAIPILYLFRHAVELYLKAILYTGNEIFKRLDKKEIFFPKKTHSVLELFRHIDTFYEYMNWKWETPIEGFEKKSDWISILKSLDDDPELGIDDKRAEVWRYPITNRGNPSLPHNFRFDLLHTVIRLEKLCTFFCGAAFGLKERLKELDGLGIIVR